MQIKNALIPFRSAASQVKPLPAFRSPVLYRSSAEPVRPVAAIEKVDWQPAGDQRQREGARPGPPAWRGVFLDIVV